MSSMEEKQQMIKRANLKIGKLGKKLDEDIQSVILLRDKISLLSTKNRSGVLKLLWIICKLLWYTDVETKYKIKRLNSTLSNIILASVSTYHVIPTVLTKLVCIILGLTESKEEYIEKMYTLSEIDKENMDIRFSLSANGRSVESFSLGTVGVLNPEGIEINIDMADGTKKPQEWLKRKYMKAIFKYDVLKAIAKMDVTVYELNDKDEPDMNKQYKHKTIDIAPNGEVDGPNYTFSETLRMEDAIIHTWISVQMMKFMAKMISDYCRFAIISSIIMIKGNSSTVTTK